METQTKQKPRYRVQYVNFEELVSKLCKEQNKSLIDFTDKYHILLHKDINRFQFITKLS